MSEEEVTPPRGGAEYSMIGLHGLIVTCTDHVIRVGKDQIELKKVVSRALRPISRSLLEQRMAVAGNIALVVIAIILVAGSAYALTR